MKFVRLSTTSKVYLLTLLLIFGILFLNQSVFAQSEESTPGVSQERLDIMNRYQSWIQSGEYGSYKEEIGNKALANFKTFLQTKIPEDTSCLNPITPTQSSFVGNIKTFFSNFPNMFTDSITLDNQAMQKLSQCKEQIKEDYKMAKKYNRLLKYLQIEEGKPNICIKADLGVGTALTAHGFNPTKVDPSKQKTGVTPSYPVYLCTGNDGLKKVRVVDASGTRLRLSPEDAAREEFKLEKLPPTGSLDKLLEKLGLK